MSQISEYFKKYKELQAEIIGNLRNLAETYGKPDEDGYWLGQFLPIQKFDPDDDLKMTIYAPVGKETLDPGYICSIDGEVSITSIDKKRRVCFYEGLFDPGAFWNEDPEVTFPVMIDVEQLVRIEFLARYFCKDRGSNHDECFKNLKSRIYDALLDLLKKQKYDHWAEPLFFHGCNIHLWKDKTWNLLVDDIPLKLSYYDGVCVKCNEWDSGSPFNIELCEGDYNSCDYSSRSVDVYKIADDGDKSEVFLPVSSLLRILHGADIWGDHSNGKELWPGIFCVDYPDNVIDENKYIEDTFIEDVEENCEDLLRDIGALIESHGAEKTFLDGRTLSAVDFPFELIGLWESARFSSYQSYRFSELAIKEDIISFYEECGQEVLRCNDGCFYQNSHIGDFEYSDGQIVDIPDCQLKKLRNALKHKLGE